MIFFLTEQRQEFFDILHYNGFTQVCKPKTSISPVHLMVNEDNFFLVFDLAERIRKHQIKNEKEQKRKRLFSGIRIEQNHRRLRKLTFCSIAGTLILRVRRRFHHFALPILSEQNTTAIALWKCLDLP